MNSLKRFWLARALLIVTLSGLAFCLPAQTKKPKLTVDFIMRDPAWIGHFPGRPYWSDDGKWLYFRWNPEGADSDSLYVVSRDGGRPRKVPMKEQLAMPSYRGDLNKARTLRVYAKNGDLFLYDIRRNKIKQLLNTVERESNPTFTGDEKKITFLRNNNLFLLNLKSGFCRQLTDFRKGSKRSASREARSPQEKWLKQQQLELFAVLREQKERREKAQKEEKKWQPRRPLPIYTQNKRVMNIQLDPNERFVTFVLMDPAKGAKNTIVPSYVTETGFTEDIRSRTKVGSPQPRFELGIYDMVRDTVYYVSTEGIPGIQEKPEYLEEYKKEEAPGVHKKDREVKKKKSETRPVRWQGPFWSDDGRFSVVIALSQDNKDRWILRLDPETGKVHSLDRQHDEAWIGGPGITGWYSRESVGWLPDNRRFWFQSEETGYSHLYTVDVVTGEKKQLTKGKFEIYNPQISRDGKYWYFTANKEFPGERQFYRMPLEGGKAIRITSMPGNNQVVLSPDEKMLAVRYSYTNKPWEIYLMPNKAGAKVRQITFSTSEEFRSYPWRDPEIVTFQARDGASVYARLYRPENPTPKGPAVIFVHGAGYLQNAHRWWSSYFREYMFHNLLADNGYTVLDIDYRGSAGYGRDWRTAIYRHMGGKDLSDQVDGARFLVEKYDVDPERIGIYGGSYGGFITLMAMFTEPDVFACGAALRPVTDWAHYNHGYTSDILNVPYLDSLAYVRSSPIYHAEGLKGALLICHGMVDTNVHFQDVVRLTQRLIELGKENWEVAIYPLENHGFRHPSSWRDEYRRIFKLFEENLK